jgi:hypothetical protein
MASRKHARLMRGLRTYIRYFRTKPMPLPRGALAVWKGWLYGRA